MGMSQAMQVLTSREKVDWYTPRKYTDMARLVMGGIDLDPASAELPQSWIQAGRYYSIDDDGLCQQWYGRVWLNPPFDDTGKWVERLIAECQAGNVTNAVLLVNSNLGYLWYERLWRFAPVCCVRERIAFLTPDPDTGQLVSKGSAKRAQTIAYFGADWPLFARVYGRIGRILLPTSTGI